MRFGSPRLSEVLISGFAASHGHLSCGFGWKTTAWALSESILKRFSRCFSNCMENSLVALASAWRSPGAVSNAWADGLGWSPTSGWARVFGSSCRSPEAMYSHGFIDRGLFDQQTVLLADDCEDDIVIMRSAMERAAIPNPLQVVHDGEEAIGY